MIEDYYKTLAVKRPSRGKSTDPVVNTEFTITGFVQPMSAGSNNAFREGKGGEQASHRIYAPVSTNLKYGDQVTEDSQTYVVVYAIQPNGISSVGHHKEYIASIVE